MIHKWLMCLMRLVACFGVAYGFSKGFSNPKSLACFWPKSQDMAAFLPQPLRQLA
jgi:hypothetical protein